MVERHRTMASPLKNTEFRAPGSNARYTSQLFYDQQAIMDADRRVREPLFTLHDEREGLICFRTEYLKDMDPSGYKTATRLLENYDHFLLLMKAKWFKDAKKEWDKELSAKMEKEATDVLREILRDEDAKRTERISAAKTLMGKAKTIGKEEKRKAGRPSKDEVEGQLKEEARVSKEEEEDLKRIQAVK